MREAVGQTAMLGEASVDKKKRLLRLRDIAYFGRFDFKRKDEDKAKPVYVGVHYFQDEETNENLIYDWRAPISSMFYDFEPGEAWYENVHGRVEGDIFLKR